MLCNAPHRVQRSHTSHNCANHIDRILLEFAKTAGSWVYPEANTLRFEGLVEGKKKLRALNQVRACPEAVNKCRKLGCT